eukprot:7885655-Alexandrium_andersonii.AAC.1
MSLETWPARFGHQEKPDKGDSASNLPVARRCRRCAARSLEEMSAHRSASERDRASPFRPWRSSH